jgi:hypothetical protein
MFSALALITSAAILFFILRYRVHIHIEYTPRTAAARKPRTRATRPPAPAPTPLFSDVYNALKGQGATPGRAREAAARATKEAPEDLTQALLLGIRYAQENKAA